MKNDTMQKTEFLRQKAEKLLKKKQTTTGLQLTESETLKLIHELEVHQIELEMQNEELSLARSLAQDATEKYIELYDFAPTGYFTLSKKGTIIELNLSGANMLGKERSHLKNSLFGLFVSNDTKSIFNLFLGKIFISKSKETCELILSTNDNLSIYVHLTGILTENGEQCLVTTTDITERKEAEDVLSESRAKYQAIFESTRTATLIVEEDTTIYMANKECYSIIGYTPAELIGQKWIQYVAPESLPEMIKNQQIRLNNPDLAPKKYQVRLVNKKGEIRDAILDIGIIPRTRQSIVSFLDITERRLAEAEIKLKNDQLLKLDAEKDKFFSIISHDLRSAFSSFLGLTQIMVEELPGLPMYQIQELAEIMRNSATSLFNLLENLLHWASMQQGLISFNPEVHQLLPIVNESIAIILEPAHNKEIELVLDIPDDLAIFADMNMLQTIIRNLVSNAVKFTMKGGKINLSAKTTGDKSVEVSIQDTGIGMSPQIIDNLFRLDVKANRQGTEGEASTGLGLLLCKEFAEKHGGKIWAESKEGKGSHFKFSLPNRINKK